MCGQSGSGKTYTTGGLFERLLAHTTLQIVILDPNSDHVHLGRLRDPDDASPEAARFAAAAGGVRVARARGAGGDHILCADFSDLPLTAQALLLHLHPIDDSDEFGCLRRITRSFGGHYSIDDVLRAAENAGDILSERLGHRIVNLGLPEWDVWRRGDEPSLVRDAHLLEQRCVVLDIGSLPRPEERTTVALALLGGRWRNRAMRRPMLIAIDEAHNVLPAVTDDPLQRATTELGILIAAEGRKFGLHLFVATQRPSKVHPNVVSQCDNLFLMRMNGAGDVHDLETLFSFVPPAMLHEALGFGLGQALVAGPISPTPMFVQVGGRLSPEGGADVPTTWANPGASSS
jgi:DNA helicase HerA-like ATPase